VEQLVRRSSQSEGGSDVNQLRSRVDGFRREFRVIASFSSPLAQANFFKQFNLICPTGWPVIWLSSPVSQNISLHPSGKSSLQIRAIPPHQRGVS
jgi:hypothetical protein